MTKDLRLSIQEKIEHFKKKNDLEMVSKNIDNNVHDISKIWGIAIELVSGTIVGVIIGLSLDNLFDSKPALLIICIILSMIATFKLIWNKYIK